LYQINISFLKSEVKLSIKKLIKNQPGYSNFCLTFALEITDATELTGCVVNPFHLSSGDSDMSQRTEANVWQLIVRVAHEISHFTIYFQGVIKTKHRKVYKFCQPMLRFFY
jgi:hypothetical protein